MRSTGYLAAVGLAAILGAQAAAAEGITVTGGVTLTSDYVDRSLSFSAHGPAIQPYIEAELNGFHAGVWGSNVDFGAGGTDTFEVDYYLGYRRETAGGLSYDLNYARLTFNDTGDCCGEFNLELGYPLGDKVGSVAVFAYDPVANTLATAIGGSYAFNDSFSVSGKYGYDEAFAHNYWDVGASYALNDVTAIAGRYFVTADTPALIAAGVSFDFNLFSL